ncbi:MAG: hypothetical protein ACXVXJ_07025 [Mycobacteriaceae bacterium]
MRLGACWLPLALVLAECGTVESGPGPELSIRAAALPDAVVGRDYEEKAVVLEVNRGSGSLSWSLVQLPESLAWLTITESTGQLTGRPSDVVWPAGAFTAQVTNGTSTARAPFTLSVGCLEGASSPCGVPDPAQGMCVGGSRVCLGGKLGVCTADPGRPPYEADTGHCGAGCDETCPRTSSNRCVGTCACGNSAGPCSGATPACCSGTDGRPESFICVSLQSPEHCGACQTACPTRPFTLGGCANSSCTFACDADHLNCNGGGVTTEGPDADGCETRVVDNPESCGACGRRCPDALPATKHASGGRFCSEGRCAYTCDGAWRNCTGATAPNCSQQTTEDDPDGCETNFADPSTCNGTVRCPGIAKGYATCTPDRAPTDPTATWSCGLKCDAGFDPDPCGAPPVCKPLGDAENCGACGRACPTTDTDTEHQSCSVIGQCCIQVCDPLLRPPCGPVLCH